MKSRVVAALLAFFVGAFGIHKFYLGETFAGIIYLIFSWTFIPGVIAFFEFLGLMLMSDRTFDGKFNAGLLAASGGSYHKSFEDKAAASKYHTETLQNLKELYEKEIITAEEYEEKRRKYLDAL
jgi:TM2 domain-containing membrane protein YozV